MTTEEIKRLAQKHHIPGTPISERWHPGYSAECRRINRDYLEEQIMNKYNALRKVNKEVKRSVLLAPMGKE